MELQRASGGCAAGNGGAATADAAAAGADAAAASDPPAPASEASARWQGAPHQVVLAIEFMSDAQSKVGGTGRAGQGVLASTCASRR